MDRLKALPVRPGENKGTSRGLVYLRKMWPYGFYDWTAYRHGTGPASLTRRYQRGTLEAQIALLALRLHRSKVGWYLDAIGKEHDL